MVNLSAASFTDQTQNDYVQKVVAESYMQLYQYAAEDFTTIPDIQRFITDLTAWMALVDEKLAVQMQMIATHTHMIPPHSHSQDGAQPVPLITNLPTNKSAIKWTPSIYPVLLNTTGTLPNMFGNRISVSVASEGSILPMIRRTLPIPSTLVPTLSPAIKDSLTPQVI